jgi:hypothetical protein
MKYLLFKVLYKGEEYETDGIDLMSNPPKARLYKDGKLVDTVLSFDLKMVETKLDDGNHIFWGRKNGNV